VGGCAATAALSDSARTTWNTLFRLPLLPLAGQLGAHAMSIAAKAPLVLGGSQERLGSQAEGERSNSAARGRCPRRCRVLEEKVVPRARRPSWSPRRSGFARAAAAAAATATAEKAMVTPRGRTAPRCRTCSCRPGPSSRKRAPWTLCSKARCRRRSCRW
jgi:hypothetical protein